MNTVVSFPHNVHAPQDFDFNQPAPRSFSVEECSARLKALKIGHTIKTRFQIKIGCVSFYPGKGSIFVDGNDKKFTRTGFEALLEVLRREGLYR